MPRKRQDFNVYKRGSNGYCYYRLSEWPEGKWKATGTKNRTEAFKIAKKAWESRHQLSLTLGAVAEPYYDGDRCPHVRRVRSQGGRMSKLHASISRGILKSYILGDPIANLVFTEAKPTDFIDYRARLQKKKGKDRSGGLRIVGPRTINRAMNILHTIYAEEMIRHGRDAVPYNPLEGLSRIKYKEKKPGIFTREEMASFFPEGSLGHWHDAYDYAAFMVAQTAGMRRGEILGLRWKHVDFVRGVIDVQESWHKGEEEGGEVKWGGTRKVPVPIRTVEALLSLRDRSHHAGDEDHIFCYRGGEIFGETWWVKRFNEFCKRAGIDRVGRNLKPHSFRHTLTTYLTEKLQNQGIDPEVLNDYLGGWTNNKTRKRYTHVEEIIFEAQRKAAAELIGVA